MEQHDTTVEGHGVSRRTALKRGALVGGMALWSVPAVQALATTTASAQAPSVVPTNPGGGTTKPKPNPGSTATAPGTSGQGGGRGGASGGGTTGGGTTGGAPGATSSSTGTVRGTSTAVTTSAQAAGNLAYTGAESSTIAAVGAALVAGGAVAVVASRNRDAGAHAEGIDDTTV